MQTKLTKHIEKNRVEKLQEFIAFLDNYKTPTNAFHEIRINGERNTYYTDLFFELGKINLRRDEIIKEITK